MATTRTTGRPDTGDASPHAGNVLASAPSTSTDPVVVGTETTTRVPENGFATLGHDIESFVRTESPQLTSSYRKSPSEDSTEVSFVSGLNEVTDNPDYKVVFFVRHGKASQENKGLDKGVIGGRDMLRPLAKKGIRAAKKLADTLSNVRFGKTVMFSSQAVRVETTGKFVFDKVNAASKTFSADRDLYYADVEAKYLRRLLEPQYDDVNHAVFFGHGKSMMAVFKKVAGIGGEAFNPTAGVMAVAIRTSNWKSYIEESHDDVRYLGWSPNDTHRVGAEAMMECVLESTSGLECMESEGPVPESAGAAPIERSVGLDNTIKGFSWGI